MTEEKKGTNGKFIFDNEKKAKITFMLLYDGFWEIKKWFENIKVNFGVW